MLRRLLSKGQCFDKLIAANRANGELMLLTKEINSYCHYPID